MLSSRPPAVNHPRPAALATAREWYAQLAQTATSGDHITRLGVSQQCFLNAS
jgi:hypothetical protein